MTKLKWGMIGGGEGSQIGPAHRLGAQADGHFSFTAGALDVDPSNGEAYAQLLALHRPRIRRLERDVGWRKRPRGQTLIS